MGKRKMQTAREAGLELVRAVGDAAGDNVMEDAGIRASSLAIGLAVRLEEAEQHIERLELVLRQFADARMISSTGACVVADGLTCRPKMGAAGWEHSDDCPHTMARRMTRRMLADIRVDLHTKTH